MTETAMDKILRSVFEIPDCFDGPSGPYPARNPDPRIRHTGESPALLERFRESVHYTFCDETISIHPDGTAVRTWTALDPYTGHYFARENWPPKEAE